MLLHDLLKKIEIEESWLDENLEIAHLAYDSRSVKPGDLFVCIKGFRTDGHKYIGSAIENGAVAVVVEDSQPSLALPQYRVKDSRAALAALADGFFGEPSRKLHMIGVTATNGKTTTTFMVDAILKAFHLTTGMIGTVKVEYPGFSEASYLTTPESLDLHHHFYDMAVAGVTHVAMEVSSSAMDLKRIGNVDFDIVALNNISREHIDLHGSFEEYYNVKANLIRRAKPDAWAVLNLDDPLSACLAAETSAQVFTYGVESADGHLFCRDLELSTGRAAFTVEIRKSFEAGGRRVEKGSFDVRLGTPGFHSVYNAMSAISIALLSGVSIEAIREGLASFHGVERRFEIIYENDYKIIDDHFANAGNIDVTLTTLTKMAYNHVIPVYAIRGSRGPAVIREAAQAIAKWAPQLEVTEIIATLSKSHVTWKDEVTQEEIDIFMEEMEKAGIAVLLYDELDDAIAEGLTKTGENDILLLAGCQGMDSGAKTVLEQIHQLRPELDASELFKPLEHRVAGQ